MKDFIQDGRVGRGLDFAGYVRLIERDLQTPLTEEMDETRRSRLSRAPLNYRRTTRVLRTCEIPGGVQDHLATILSPQLWMVLSEPWCGDSAQSLPIIAKLASYCPLITLRIMLRDENPDIMDLYTTGGTRSIPKLVAFDEQGNELFRWGPRPKGAQDEFVRARKEGLDRARALERVHLWYAKDGGRAVQEEVTTLLMSLTAGVRPALPDAPPSGQPPPR